MIVENSEECYMREKDKYKFVHIAFQSGVDFINNLIDFFNTDYNDTELRQNLWVTCSEKVYERNQNSCDIILEKCNEIKLINKYGGLGQYIIVHGLHSNGFNLMMIKPWLIKRIVWRTWGHDIDLPKPHPTNILKTVFRYTSFVPYYYITSKFAVIGTANIVDDLKVKDVYRQRVKTVRLPYCKPNVERNKTAQMLSKIKYVNDGKIRIMVGHSGFPIDNHISIIKSILKFVNDNTLLYIMLPYGDSEYINQVESFASKNLGNHCIIFKDRLPYSDYISFISTIDIALFGMKNSSALGNIALLVYYKKKIYLNPIGDIAKGFDSLNLPYGNVLMINEEEYTDFIKPFYYIGDNNTALLDHILSPTYCKSQWDKLISMCTHME